MNIKMGKKNGNGKEYYKNKLIFEGENLNGKRNGKCKEYNESEILIVEGEYKNGRKWNGIGYSGQCFMNEKIYELKEGNGYINQFYLNTHYLDFEGEYLNSIINEKRKEYYSSLYYQKLKYDGEYLDKKRHGKGKEYNFNYRLLFEGEYLYGKRWDGIIYDNNHKIVSELKNGKGYIIESIFKQLDFEGEYINGLKMVMGKNMMIGEI